MVFTYRALELRDPKSGWWVVAHIEFPAKAAAFFLVVLYNSYRLWSLSSEMFEIFVNLMWFKCWGLVITQMSLRVCCALSSANPSLNCQTIGRAEMRGVVWRLGVMRVLLIIIFTAHTPSVRFVLMNSITSFVCLVRAYRLVIPMAGTLILWQCTIRRWIVVSVLYLACMTRYNDSAGGLMTKAMMVMRTVPHVYW